MQIQKNIENFVRFRSLFYKQSIFGVMYVQRFCKTFLLCAGLVYAAQFAYDYYKKKKLKKEIKRKDVHEVIMFAHGTLELRKSKYSRCAITESMDRLLYYLNSPRYTLDICMYVLTNLDIANVILKLHYRGVKVRIIIDADMAYSSGSNVKKLEKQGIPTRWMKSTNLMHHKFCLLDCAVDNVQVTPLLITGSLNWTNQALYGNWENVLVTSQIELIRQYQAEFEKLWVLFKPIVN